MGSRVSSALLIKFTVDVPHSPLGLTRVLVFVRDTVASLCGMPPAHVLLDSGKFDFPCDVTFFLILISSHNRGAPQFEHTEFWPSSLEVVATTLVW